MNYKINMLLIEFEENIEENDFIVRYKSEKEINWSYIRMDIETLNLLTSNFGIMSTKFVPKVSTSSLTVTSPSSKQFDVTYCGVPITLNCGNNLVDSNNIEFKIILNDKLYYY